MTEMEQWEKDNKDKIFQWKAEWDVKEGYKVVTFTLKDKTEKTFEIKL